MLYWANFLAKISIRKSGNFDKEELFLEKSGHFWFPKVGIFMTFKGKIEKRNEERGTERNLVPLISGTRFRNADPRNVFLKPCSIVKIRSVRQILNDSIFVIFEKKKSLVKLLKSWREMLKIIID